MKKTKYACFGKVSVNKVRKEEKKVEALQRRKKELGMQRNLNNFEQESVDEDLALAIEELNTANFEREINSLKSKLTRKGKRVAIFDLKDRVLG